MVPRDVNQGFVLYDDDDDNDNIENTAANTGWMIFKSQRKSVV